MGSGWWRTCRKAPTSREKLYDLRRGARLKRLFKAHEFVVPARQTLTRRVTKVVRSKPEFATRDTSAADPTSKSVSRTHALSPNADMKERLRVPGGQRCPPERPKENARVLFRNTGAVIDSPAGLAHRRCRRERPTAYLPASCFSSFLAGSFLLLGFFSLFCGFGAGLF